MGKQNSRKIKKRLKELLHNPKAEVIKANGELLRA